MPCFRPGEQKAVLGQGPEMVISETSHKATPAPRALSRPRSLTRRAAGGDPLVPSSPLSKSGFHGHELATTESWKAIEKKEEREEVKRRAGPDFLVPAVRCPAREAASCRAALAVGRQPASAGRAAAHRNPDIKRRRAAVGRVAHPGMSTRRSAAVQDCK